MTCRLTPHVPVVVVSWVTSSMARARVGLEVALYKMVTYHISHHGWTRLDQPVFRIVDGRWSSSFQLPP